MLKQDWLIRSKLKSPALNGRAQFIQYLPVCHQRDAGGSSKTLAAAGEIAS